MTPADITEGELLDILERELHKDCKGSESGFVSIRKRVARGETLRQAVFEWGLDELYRLINGEMWPLSKGVTTYLSDEPRCRRNHDACLELEKRGKIHRFREEADWVIWVPVSEPKYQESVIADMATSPEDAARLEKANAALASKEQP